MVAVVSLAVLLACAPATASVPAPAAQVPSAPAAPSARQVPQPLGAPVAAASAPEMVAPGGAARTGMASAERGLASFTGLWRSHSFMLTIDEHGAGDAAWRTYRWCSSAPPPCDDMRDDLITPGGRAAFVVQGAGERWADVNVVDSSDPASVPMGPARLALEGDGRLRLILESTAGAAGAVGTHAVAINLCRPGAARSTACGA